VSIRDGAWTEDIGRLAGVIALDLPGSAAERRLRSVARGVAGLLLLALCFSLGTAIRLELGMFDAAANPNSTQLFFRTGGLQILLVLGAVVLLLVHRKHMAPPSSTHALLAGLVGLVHVAIALVGGQLLEATVTLPRMLAGNIFFSAIMLSLMALSGLRPK
jgi:phosphate/sulfate permease